MQKKTFRNFCTPVLAYRCLVGSLIGLLLYVCSRCVDLLCLAALQPDEYEVTLRRAAAVPELVALLVPVIVAPLVEEFLFRGLIVDWLGRRIRRVLAIGISIFLFGLAHYEYIGTPYIFNVLFLAVACHVLVETSKRLAPAIICHATLNLAVLAPKSSLLSYFLSFGVYDRTTQLTVIALVGAVAMAALLYALRPPRQAPLAASALTLRQSTGH